MLADDVVGYIFNEITKLNLKTHLPSLTNFWENMLLNANGYKKDVMGIHLNLNQQETLKPEHFERWLSLLNQTIDCHFAGVTSDKMKQRASQIASTMKVKLNLI